MLVARAARSDLLVAGAPIPVFGFRNRDSYVGIHESDFRCFRVSYLSTRHHGTRSRKSQAIFLARSRLLARALSTDTLLGAFPMHSDYPPENANRVGIVDYPDPMTQ